MTSSITQITGFAHLADLPCWKLCHGDATVVISQYGAHVLHYATRSDHPQANQQQQSLLWLSPKAVWQDQQPIRGGVPICWPWFGKINPLLLTATTPEAGGTQKLPNHGLVRTRFWQKTAEQITPDHARIEFSIEVHDIPWSPEPQTLRYQVQLDQQLTLTLSCDTVIAQQAALHSYFTVPDSTKAQVQPLPTHYYNKVTDSECSSQSDMLHFHGEIDRVYFKTADTLTLSTEATQLQIDQQGHDASVLWNPAPEKAAASADIPKDQWSAFVCVETARLTTTAAPLSLTQIIRPL